MTTRYSEAAARHLPAVTDLLDRFLAGTMSYKDFNFPFQEAVGDVLENEPVPFGPHAAALDDMYELVYVGGADPVSSEDAKYGILGIAELRGRLRAMRAAAGRLNRVAA